MNQVLSAEQVRSYHERGYLSGIPCLSREEVAASRSRLEAMEFEHGGSLSGIYQFKPHIHQRWAHELATHPTIIGAVSDVVGPDLLVIQFTIWVKEAGSPSYVSWHQDGTYFGLEPHEHVTAWLALSPSVRETGCVEVISGSHLDGPRNAYRVADADNMLKTGQHIDVDLAEEEVAHLELQPGEFSLHHTMTLHNSRPNGGLDRRIGLGISYIPTRVRSTGAARVSAMLVHGEDRYHHFEPEPPPRPGEPLAALEAHARAMELWNRGRQEQLARSGGQ